MSTTPRRRTKPLGYSESIAQSRRLAWLVKTARWGTQSLALVTGGGAPKVELEVTALPTLESNSVRKTRHGARRARQPASVGNVQVMIGETGRHHRTAEEPCLQRSSAEPGGRRCRGKIVEVVPSRRGLVSTRPGAAVATDDRQVRWQTRLSDRRSTESSHEEDFVVARAREGRRCPRPSRHCYRQHRHKPRVRRRRTEKLALSADGRVSAAQRAW